MVGRSLFPRPCTDLVKNGSMILQHRVHRPRVDEVGEGERAIGAGACISLWIPRAPTVNFALMPSRRKPHPPSQNGGSRRFTAAHTTRFQSICTLGISRARNRGLGKQNISNAGGPHVGTGNPLYIGKSPARSQPSEGLTTVSGIGTEAGRRRKGGKSAGI